MKNTNNGIICSNNINSGQHLVWNETSTEIKIKTSQIILIDDVTKHEWIVRMSNGELIIEPTEISDIRDCKINKILK